MSNAAVAPTRADGAGGLQAAILAGGLGTRLRPALDGATPKVLAPIAGRPFLGWLLAWLATGGVDRATLLLGHGAALVTEAAAALAPPGLALDWVIESEPLGTGGALRQAAPVLAAETVLVLNGDSLAGTSLGGFLAAHRRSGADGTVLCAEVPDSGRYGRVEIDGVGRIRRFAEKDPAAGPGPVNAGVYALGQALLARLMAMPGPSLERDFFMKLPPGTLAAHAGPWPFIDIGTPDSFALAQVLLPRLIASPA